MTMALPHAQPMDVINVGPFGEELHGTVSTSLIKTEQIQLLHMVLSAHQDQPQHHVDKECTIHCLEGEVEVVTGSGVRKLRPGNVIVLPARQQHALRARAESAVLVTLLLDKGDAGDGGGAGHRREFGKDSPARP
jgi:quercetin dioxygenase-like cupin family protein